MKSSPILKMMSKSDPERDFLAGKSRVFSKHPAWFFPCSHGKRCLR